ncbi:MAG: hypothetical protein ACOWWR_10010 [Eubacteriales bacterium]
MNRNEFEKLKFDHMVNTMVNQELFAQWLRNFFYLNHELHKEYDTIYQSSFYVKFHELITIGLDYTEEVSKHLTNSGNKEKIEFYKELKRGLIEFKSEFSESEIEFIEYKRHSSSHIFQHHYENRLLDNGKIQTKRKKKLIDELSRDFQKILIKYGFDRGFDEYMTSKLYPKITRLYNNLEAIKKRHRVSEENI